MPVGWIDRLYNNTDTSWQWSSTDREHNGEIWSGGPMLSCLCYCAFVDGRGIRLAGGRRALAGAGALAASGSRS